MASLKIGLSRWAGVAVFAAALLSNAVSAPAQAQSSKQTISEKTKSDSVMTDVSARRYYRHGYYRRYYRPYYRPAYPYYRSYYPYGGYGGYGGYGYGPRYYGWGGPRFYGPGFGFGIGF